MTLEKGLLHAADEETKQVIYDLSRRLASIRPQQDRLKDWADRADRLYYAEDITQDGPDLNAFAKSARTVGMAHVGQVAVTPYIDVPSSLQSVEPIENVVATDNTKAARESAAQIERLRTAWKHSEDWDLKFHKAVTVKSLYGLTAARIYWDAQADPKKACVEIVEQPRNLWMGYKTDEYAELEWAAYVNRYEPNALIEAFGVNIVPFQQEDGKYIPLVEAATPYGSEYPDNWDSEPRRAWLQLGDARIEVWDYWYRQPVWRGTKFIRMDTYNVVIAGNVIVRGPLLYPEYEGGLPYEPLFNTFIPGMPTGRPDLYDVEQLLREKMTRIDAGAQMIANAVAGDFWQLTGADAPSLVPAGLKPLRNQMVAPGAGNRIETITPFIAEFQLEQYLGRIDRELAASSGLNDLLLGLAPAQVLSSSKAINALIANVEARLSIRRKLLYKWSRNVWEKVLKVWAKKDKSVATILKSGGGYLDITDPSLAPRDEQENAIRAANLVNAKLWSQVRGMDAVGVDDPETEQELIREESTDATLWPERVQVMAQLMAALQSLGLQAPAGAQAQAQGQMTSGQSDLRNALGAQTPDNAPGGPGPGGAPEAQGQTPGLPGLPPEAGGSQPLVTGPGNEAAPPLLQGMVQNGEAKGRLMTQTKLRGKR
jgi:hypothetical protein